MQKILFRFPRSKLIKVENFEAYFKKQQADSNCGFAEEYEVCGYKCYVFNCSTFFLKVGKLFPFYGEVLGERQPSLRGERSSCMSPGGPSETSRGGSLLASSSFWKPQAFLTCGHITSIFTCLPCMSVSQCLFSSYKDTSDIALRALPYCSMTSSYLEYICESCIFKSDFIHTYRGLEVLHIYLRDAMLPITSLHSHFVLSYSLSSITNI